MGRIYCSPWEDFPDVIVQTTVPVSARAGSTAGAAEAQEPGRGY